MKGFWKNKNVLVTGSDGFIGSHLTERLVNEGANVKAFVYYNSFGKNGWLDVIPANTLKKISIIAGDIRDPKRVEEAVKGCDTVFHLASLIAIPYSYVAPNSYVSTNIEGALNVLNSCLKVKGVRLIHTSTSEVYGTAMYVPIDEKHPLQGQSPYSASKIGADMMAESFHRSFNMKVSIARPFNTYGPRQSSRAIIPTILSQLYQGKKSIKLGSLTPTRDFNFVADTVTGFLKIAESDKTIGQVVNVGTGKEISIGELVDTIFEVTGKKARIIQEKQRMRPQKSEVNRLLCDSSKLFELTGFKTKYSLKQGLKLTSKWVLSNLNSYQKGNYQI